MRQGRGGLTLLGLELLALATPLSLYGQNYGPLRDERMPPDQQRSVYDSSQQGQNSSPPLYNQPQPPNNGPSSNQLNGPPAPEQYNQPQPGSRGPGGYGPPPDPRLERLGPPNGPNPQPGPPPVPPGFELTKEEQDDLDRLLDAWEKRGERIKSFECGFTRLFYNRVWNNGGNQGSSNGDKPVTVLKGELKYSAPDKGLFVVHASSPTSAGDGREMGLRRAVDLPLRFRQAEGHRVSSAAGVARQRDHQRPLALPLRRRSQQAQATLLPQGRPSTGRPGWSAGLAGGPAAIP